MGDLTLTIWTPKPDGKARPVLVWLHGGAFISGAGSLDWYDGSILTREGDIVVVGVNYRLGAPGYLCRPEISDGNLGTLDQLAALCWVREYIRGFGGGPVCITLAGQSAGAAAIGALIAMPEARSLAEAVAERDRVFAYQFDWSPQRSRFRACHCIDLPFLLGCFEAWHDAPMLAGADPAEMRALSAAMRAAWLAFVRDGSPASAATLPWVPYEQAQGMTMRFDRVAGMVGDATVLGTQA